jgi:hypothetical protein
MRLLGLTGPASVQQIKHAYRELALRLHPDKSHGDEAARVQFLSVSDAYRLLIRAARAVEEGRKVGVCAGCGQFGEVVAGLDGSSLCPRCVLEPGGGRLLPMPALVVAKCLATVVLLALAVYLLFLALTASEPRLIAAWSLAAFGAGVLSLMALARTCLSVVHCLTGGERAVQDDYRRTEARHRSWLRARRWLKP